MAYLDMVIIKSVYLGYGNSNKGSDIVDKKTEQYINSALASAKMEGFRITPTVEADCIKIVSGELTIADYIKRVTEANTPVKG